VLNVEEVPQVLKVVFKDLQEQQVHLVSKVHQDIKEDHKGLKVPKVLKELEVQQALKVVFKEQQVLVDLQVHKDH